MKKYRCYHELLWVKRGDYTCIACIHCYSVYKTVKPYDISDDNWIKQSRDGYEATKKKFRSIRYPSVSGWVFTLLTLSYAERKPKKLWRQRSILP